MWVRGGGGPKRVPSTPLTPATTHPPHSVQQSRGWEHYAVHRPEPHILLFRRALGCDPVSGKVVPALRDAAIEQFNREYA